MFEKYLTLLENLKPDQPALWGKMTAHHMVEHLILTFESSTGKFKVECTNSTEKAAVAKNIWLGNRQLPKLFINPAIGPDLLPLKYSGIDEARQILLKEINYYQIFYKQNPDAKATHVSFGDLNKKEWDIFHKKHFTHHLSQYGMLGTDKH